MVSPLYFIMSRYDAPLLRVSMVIFALSLIVGCGSADFLILDENGAIV